MPNKKATIDALADSDFEHYESGKLRAGIKWVNTQDGPLCPGECYQFSTFADLLARARAFQNDPSIVEFSLVTHKGQYQRMRTVFKWKRSARTHIHIGTGRCPACGHYGDDCTGVEAIRFRAESVLANVQRLQAQFWAEVQELETVIGEMRGDDCELDSAKDFNDLDLDDVLEGRGDDGEDAE